MEVWSAITKTLRCLWCVSDPNSPPEQTSPAASSRPEKENINIAIPPAPEDTSLAATPCRPTPHHLLQLATPSPPSLSLPLVQDTTTRSDVTDTPAPSGPPAAQPLNGLPQWSPTVIGGEDKLHLPVSGTPLVTIQNEADTDALRAPRSERSEPPGASSTHLDLGQPAPTDAPDDSPNSDATEESSVLDSPPGGWQDFKKTAKGALWNILKVAKEASAPLPPLQTALGGAVALMGVADVSARRPESEIVTELRFPTEIQREQRHNRQVRRTCSLSGTNYRQSSRRTGLPLGDFTAAETLHKVRPRASSRNSSLR